MSAASQDRLAALLRETGRAHHDAFAQTDGVDPDWAGWYAAFLLPRLEVFGGLGLDARGLARALLEAEARQKVESPDADWPTYYAARLLAGAADERTR
jgi:NAD(P)H-hydrate epimerase